MGRDSSAGIATCYRLDGLGIEPRWRRDFPHLSRPALGPTQSSIQRVPGLSRGVKRPGRSADHTLPFGAKVKERVQLYLYFPLWAFVACSRANFIFKFYLNGVWSLFWGGRGVTDISPWALNLDTRRRSFTALSFKHTIMKRNTG